MFDAIERLSIPTAADAPVAEWRRQAARRFAAIGLPTRRLEDWKYTDLGALKEILFRTPEGPFGYDGPLPRLVTGGEAPAHRLVFVGGVFNPALSILTATPGVTLGGLATEASADACGLSAPEEGERDRPMVALNAALAGDGVLLRVGAGIDVARPIELVFLGGLGEEARAWHPRHRIELGRGSSVSVHEVHVGVGGGCYLANHVTEIVVGENAGLRHTLLQTEGGAGYHIGSRFVGVAAGGRYEAFGLTIGGRLTRNEIAVSLDGPGAGCTLSGAYLLRGREHCDNTTVIDHRVPHTSCREVFKGVLDGAARGVFQGRIVVHPGAQKTDGQQHSKALLLSDEAEVDQKPELEIYADDVKCAHGAAAGQLDRDELFYLRSRGIPEGQARRLLIEGFLVDVFDEVAEPEVRAALLAHACAWFDASGEAGR